jgi:hypothetical protein
MVDEIFEKYRLGIMYELLHAHNCLENYNQIDSAMQIHYPIKYHHFFFYTKRAFYDCFINSIRNVIHYEKDTSNLPKLINYMECNPNLSKIFNKSFRQKIDVLIDEDGDYKCIIYKIKYERDNYISHNQLLSFEFKPMIKYEEALEYLNILIKAFNDISESYDKKSFPTFNLPFLQADALLQELLTKPESA